MLTHFERYLTAKKSRKIFLLEFYEKDFVLNIQMPLQQLFFILGFFVQSHRNLFNIVFDFYDLFSEIRKGSFTYKSSKSNYW